MEYSILFLELLLMLQTSHLHFEPCQPHFMHPQVQHRPPLKRVLEYLRLLGYREECLEEPLTLIDCFVGLEVKSRLILFTVPHPKALLI